MSQNPDDDDELPRVAGGAMPVAGETPIRRLIEQCCEHYIATGQDFAQMEVSIMVKGRAFHAVMGISIQEIVGPDKPMLN